MSNLAKYSVTAADHANSNDGMLQIVLGPIGTFGQERAGLPPWWSPARDMILSTSLDLEAMWASAVYKAITKKTARGWKISDANESGLRIQRTQDLLHGVDGTGWVPFMSRHLQDYLTTDNGAFVEIVRASGAAGSKILGLVHLDSLRCTRTGDPLRPVLYRDDTGAEHTLRDYQVLAFADMPSPRQTFHGVGRCAASRAWETIVKLAAVETYFREKVSGTRNLAIHLVSGITKPQLHNALAQADAESAQKGHLVYRGAVLIPGLDTSASNVNVVTIPLAEIPDGFQVEQERRDAYLRYANALGVPVQDIQPLSGQGLGTGTQTEILDEAAAGQGIAAWDAQWEHALSFRVLPATTTFTFATNDIRDQKAQAEVAKLRADERAARIASRELTVEEARQLAVDSGDLPAAMLAAPDETPGGALYDDQKLAEPVAAEDLPAPTIMATKAAGHTGVMLALYPDVAAAHAITALPGVTQPIDDIHLTLAFLGDTRETTLASKRQNLIETLQQWAHDNGKPLSGTVNGMGRFYHAEDDETNAVYVSPDVPGLPDLRQSLCAVLEIAGFDYSQDHGFVPHLTVAYVSLEAPTPEMRIDTPIRFDSLTLAWGEEQQRFLLGTVTKATTRIPTDEDIRTAVALLADAEDRVGQILAEVRHA